MRLWLVVSCLWVLGAHASEQDFEQFVANYAQQFQQELAKKQVPGAAIAVVHGKKQSKAIGFGVRKVGGKDKVDANTRFRLASVSKTFAGTVAAILDVSGAVPLGLNVKDTLPQLSFKNPNFSQKLHLEQLLSHSTGIMANAYDNLVEAGQSLTQIAPAFENVEPICLPSQCYSYQNVLFAMYGEVVADKTGLSYDEQVKRLLFAPLNMPRANTGMTGLTADNNYAWPHIKGRKTWRAAKVNKRYYQVSPAAGVNASANDMVIWLKAHLGYYPQVVSDKALAVMREPRIETRKELRRKDWRQRLKSAHYGLGVRIYQYDGVEVIYHSGYVQGYRSDFLVIPEWDIGFAVMLNGESGQLNGLTTRFIEQAKRYVQQSAQLAKQPAKAKTSPTPSVPSQPSLGK